MQIARIARTQTLAWIHLGFMFTGVGTALLGCVLPTLSSLWHMDDSRAGILFVAQFLGSALGALLVGKNFVASLRRGYVLLIAGAISIPLFPFIPQAVRFLSFGLGLGLTMTATSMLIGTLYPDSRGRALSLLNAFWTIGAALCPEIASIWVSRWTPTNLFVCLAVLLSIVFALVYHPMQTLPHRVTSLNASRFFASDFQLVLVFAALGCFYVGVEASIGGWVMSYVHRLPGVNRAWAPVATSFFWIGLLCGRMLAPGLLLRISEARLLTASLPIALVSTVLMLLSHVPIAITASVALTGFVLGPIFPLCLAKTLGALKDSSKAKWVFAISGTGAAIFPWLTGIVSARAGSLRIGLLVPVLALSGMMLLNRLEPSSAAS